jgi:hypothetical protein
LRDERPIRLRRRRRCREPSEPTHVISKCVRLRRSSRQTSVDSPKQVQGASQVVERVAGILDSARPRLGYEFNTPGVRSGFAVFAESLLPRVRRSTLAGHSAFSDLNYAIYLGRSSRGQDLLVTSLRRFPITGRHASLVVPFGDSVFTLVVFPNGSLGGGFFESLPWIIAVAGVLLAVAAALMTDRLARRRRYAEQLAGDLEAVASENRRMYPAAQHRPDAAGCFAARRAT